MENLTINLANEYNSMESKDSLQLLNEFGTTVCGALNAAKVQTKEDDETICAVMLVVGDPTSDQMPIGASLNFDHETKLWTITPQATMSERA